VSRLTALTYSRPTRVQQRTIATLMSRRDVLVRSDTGSGKTLAYLVPAVSHLITQEPRINRLGGTVALVLAPTRELCLQIFGCLQALLLPFHWVVPGAIMGGENRQKEKARLRRGVTFLVATPGRLLDHLKSTESFSVQPLSWLVLDEADRLLDLGFEAALTEILSLLQERAGSERCTALLSATLPKSLLKLVRIALRDPLSIDVAAEDAPAQRDEADGAPSTLSIPQQLSQTFVTVPCRLRLVALVAALRTWLCRGVQRVVVFVSTCQAVDFYADLLPQLEANGDVLLPTRLFKLHGMLPQSERTQNFRDFQTADTGILLCTDVAARGLDFPAVGAALQVDPPGLPEEYVHRIGRTARVGHKGEALIFLLPTEAPYVDVLASRGAHLGETNLCSLLGALPGSAAAGRPGKAMQVAELHPAALTMLKRVEAVTSSNADIRKVAKDAFRAHVRAYAAHPSVAKSIFHVKRLHLGHLAASFGLKATPVLLGKSTPGPKARYGADPLPSCFVAPLTRPLANAAQACRPPEARARVMRMSRVVSIHGDHHQHNKRDDQANDDGNLAAHAALLDDLRQLALCCGQPRRGAVHVLLQLVQHLALRVQLLADGETHVAQARDALAQVVEILILPPASRACQARASQGNEARNGRSCLRSSACCSVWLFRYDSFWLVIALSSLAAADLAGAGRGVSHASWPQATCVSGHRGAHAPRALRLRAGFAVARRCCERGFQRLHLRAAVASGPARHATARKRHARACERVELFQLRRLASSAFSMRKRV
jgi:ATP-dependent RNA helicase DDX31/DBP7